MIVKLKTTLGNRPTEGTELVAQRATVPMIIALMAVTLGFATVLLVQENTAPPMTYAGAYVGMMLTVYIGVRLWLPHADALLIPIVTVLSGMGLIMIYFCLF